MRTMGFVYTRHQLSRGSRPDATCGTTRYLLKNADHLRLTYQIRMLTYAAGCVFASGDGDRELEGAGQPIWFQ